MFSMRKKWTMKDIARECGVSTATVSYVLNDVASQSISAATRKRILHVANMVGYVTSASARALATGKTNYFGVYMPHAGNSAGKQKLLKALAEEAERVGYRLMLLTHRCLESQVKDVDAVFAIDISREDFAALGENSFVPLLYLDGQIDNWLFYCVTFDAAALKERALKVTGCKKAVLVCDLPRCRDYLQYLHSHFDDVMDVQQVAEVDSDTVLLTEYPAFFPGKALKLDGEELPLDYQGYAAAVVAAAVKAIARDETPAEHHIRI